MKGILWIFVNGIIFSAATNIATSQLENSNKSFKFALEEALGLNNTNNTENIQFLNKVQRVVANMKTVIRNNKSKRCTVVKPQQFTDFLKDLIKKLNLFEDLDLEMFFNVFNNEMRKYHYRGCKFYEITENHAFRTIFPNLLHDIKIQPANRIKSVLKDLSDKMENENYNKNERELVDIVNALYRQDSLEKLNQFLITIDAFRLQTRKSLDLVKIVREGLRSIIFDHYSNLNANARKALREQVFEYFNNLPQQTITKLIEIKSSKAKKTLNIAKRQTTLKQDKFDYARRDVKLYTSKSLYIHTPLIVGKPDKIRNVQPESDGQISNKHKNTLVVQRREMKLDKKPKNRTNSFNRMHNSRHKTIQTQPSGTTKRFCTEDNFHMRYETDAYEYMITEPRRKKLTFRTLYPKFLNEMTESKPLLERRQMYYKTTIGEPEYSWEEDEINNSIQKTRPVNAIHLVRNLGGTVKYGMKSSPSRRKDTKLQNSKMKVGKPEYSWEEDEISNSIKKPGHVQPSQLIKIMHAPVSAGMKSSQIRRSKAQSQYSKQKINSNHFQKPLLKSIKRPIAEIKSLEPGRKLQSKPQESNHIKSSNRRSHRNSNPYSNKQKAGLRGRDLKTYNRKNDIHNISQSNSNIPTKKDLIEVQVPAVRRAIEVQIKNDRKVNNSKINSDRNETQNKITDNDKIKLVEGENSILIHGNKPKANYTLNIEEVPKQVQVGEGINHVNISNVNVTNVEINKEKQLDSVMNVQEGKELKPQTYLNEKIENNTLNKFELNHDDNEYNITRSSTETRANIISDSINNFNLSRQKMDTIIPKKESESKYEVKRDEVEITDNDQQKPNYDGNDEEKDLEPWVPVPDDDFNKEIEDYENDFADYKNVEQKNKDEIVFRASNLSPRSINEMNVTNKENTAAVATNITTITTSKPTVSLTTAEITISNLHFADVAPFAYADNNIFAEVDKMTTTQTTMRHSKQMAQQMMKNFNILESAERLKKEVEHSGAVNFEKDLIYDTDQENLMVDDVAADVFPEFVPALGKIARRN